MNELGVYVGFQYSRKINTHFNIGVQSRLFYEVTTGILSQVTLTPTLTYQFSKSKRKNWRNRLISLIGKSQASLDSYPAKDCGPFRKLS